MKHIILPGLTTTPRSDWRKKTEEIDELGLEEIALFSTFLAIEERKKLYDLLKRTHLKRIPHVHLRDDMENWELDYLCEKYETKVFNMHADEAAIAFLSRTKYQEMIFMENQERSEKKLGEAADKCAGICLDASHAEDLIINHESESSNMLLAFLDKYKIGCSHVSVIKKDPHVEYNYITGEEEEFHSDHWMDDLSELDYVKKYVKYLPKYVSIELENPFSEQIKAKEYLEKIINGK